MAQERGTGALLKVKHGQGRETTFYGGSIHLTKASQKNLKLARKRSLDKQNDKGNNYIAISGGIGFPRQGGTNPKDGGANFF